MTKKACGIYIDQAILALEKMRSTVNDLPPDATISFLEAAQEVTKMLGRSIGEGICAITETQLHR